MRILQQLGKESVIYGIGSALGPLLRIVTAPILTRIFTPDDYGIISLVQLAIGFAVIFAGMNIGSGISYYYFHFEEDEKKKNVLSMGFVTLLGTSLLIAGIFALSAPWISGILEIRAEGNFENYSMVQYLRIGAISLFIGILATGLQSILRILRLPVRFLVVDVVILVVHFLAVLGIVVYLDGGIEGVFWAGVVGPLSGLLIAAVFVRKHFVARISWGVLPLILAYSIPQLPAVILNWFQSQLGRVALNHFATLRELGLFSIAFSLASMILIVNMAFRLAYDPFSMSVMKSSNAVDIYSRVYTWFTFAFGCLLGLVIFGARPVLQILTPVEYHEAYSLILWLAISGFYMGANNILATGIWITRNTIYTSYAQLVTFAFVAVATLTLVPMFGALGAALGMVIGAVAQSVAYYFFSQRFYFVPYRFLSTHIAVLLIALTGVLLNTLIEDAALGSSILIGLPILFIVPIICYLIILRDSERSILQRSLRSLVRGEWKNLV